MNWKKHYEENLCTAEEAIKVIKDNDKLVFSHAAAAPIAINRALTAAKDNYKDVSIYHMIYLGEPHHLDQGMEGHFKLFSSFINDYARSAIGELRGDFIPAHFHHVPALFKENLYPVDVAVIQVTPPDENGNCSLGVSCDYTKAAAECAKLVIAQVNEQMPWVHGDNIIHVSKLNRIVEVSEPLPQVQDATIGDLEYNIAEKCASLIKDGDTIQVGIGAIPDAVLTFLRDHKDLGVHTELFTGGLIDLYEAGAITGKRKSLLPGKMVATFIMGNKRSYDFVNNNPDFELHPVDFVNDPYVIGQNDNLISINSCIEVDLTGQVASESFGLRQYSGSGGQFDFVTGARISKGGKSIIAIRSTAAGGKVSRITPFLQEGAAITTLRNDVDYIITEYGIASLRGKSLRDRAKALIEIAHPDFREELNKVFDKRFGKK